MNVQELYQQKLTTAEEAVKDVYKRQGPELL